MAFRRFRSFKKRFSRSFHRPFKHRAVSFRRRQKTRRFASYRMSRGGIRI